MVDMEREASVITFPDGDFVNPTVTRYPIAGAIDGFFSEDGSRLAIPAAEGEDRLAIHVLEGGTDTVVATVPFAGASGVPAGASWSQGFGAPRHHHHRCRHRSSPHEHRPPRRISVPSW